MPPITPHLPERNTGMTVLELAPTSELSSIAALLDRLDPQPAVCSVPGCLHLHGEHDVIDLSAAA